ncbi:Late embryogenesis abundant protein [Thalictrum thalictroides]|uniref:Late embryogenesis abundant protein n=1 Tax=Thalictrum thalictroides TaxID=46969 RepID=A0A7J6URI2_THATH|nr:Late embryogenesis abundant protein [Thalictrum thalictroides]
MEGGKKSRRGLKICCAVAAVIIGILIVTLVIVYFTVLRPKQPITIAHPATLQKVEFVVFPELKLNISLGLVITIKNRNYGSFAYKGTTTYINYRGGLVAEAPITGDKIQSRGKLNVTTSVEIIADRLITNPNFWMDLNAGSFNFSSSTTLKGRVNVFNIIKADATAQSMCHITVYIKAGFANSTCYSKLKM